MAQQRFGFDQRPWPKKCECGVALPQPVYDYNDSLTQPYREKRFWAKCEACESYTVWSYPQVFKRIVLDPYKHVGKILQRAR